MYKERNLLINELLPLKSSKHIDEILKKYNIEIPDNFLFSNKVNIIIGSNGSGKTRFLKALKELYQFDQSVRIMFGYCPSLSDHFTQTISGEGELPPYTLYEYLYTSEASFEDLLQAIEKYGPDFISGLFQYRSISEKNLYDEIWRGLVDDFFKLSSKRLVQESREIYVENSKGVKQTLSESLKLFSPGELMMFYMTVFLALQKNCHYSKRVIILDEPECHLHPKALLSFVESLLNNHDVETIWIATHSLFLVPSFKFDNIIHFKNGAIEKRKSTIYQNVFSNVLGENNEKIKEFFSSISNWQFCEYIAECFTEPSVVDTINPKDEQVQLFVKFLEEHKNKKILNVLDYGGGSARLGLTLKLLDPNMKDNIKYDIFDIEPEYDGDDFSVYTKVEDIKQKYDCIVLMNVLHEIEPQEWHEIFNNIYNLMSENAYLFFVEVISLTQGENPNKTGYLVLGKEELICLFNERKRIAEVKFDENQKSVCVAIPKSVVKKITNDSIVKAITSLKERSLNEIKLLRSMSNSDENKDDENIRETRRYAFLAQQYINAKLFCDDETVSKNMNADGSRQTKEKIATDWGVIHEIQQKTFSKSEIIESVKTLLRNDIVFNSYDPYIRSICNSLNIVLLNYEKYNILYTAYFSNCWKDILKLEKRRVDKRIIAIFLKAASLLGDKRCTKRFYNNKYDKYIAEYNTSDLIYD